MLAQAQWNLLRRLSRALLLSKLSSGVAFLSPFQQTWNSNSAGRCVPCKDKIYDKGSEDETFLGLILCVAKKHKSTSGSGINCNKWLRPKVKNEAAALWLFWWHTSSADKSALIKVTMTTWYRNHCIDSVCCLYCLHVSSQSAWLHLVLNTELLRTIT